MSLIEKEKSAPFDNGPVNPRTGQYGKYAVLPKSERDKGFVRPLRKSYMHVGAPPPEFPLRDLTPEEKERESEFGYVKYERYPEDRSPALGKYWTQADLDAVGHGCGQVTTMSDALAETYARDPSYYGATFCCGCQKHLPVAEFVWDGTDERVGS